MNYQRMKLKSKLSHQALVHSPESDVVLAEWKAVLPSFNVHADNAANAKADEAG